MYLFFDTETTGLPRDRYAPVTSLENWPRMVQLAWLSYDDEENLLEEHSDIIKPVGFVIPDESALIHGINHQRALEEGCELDRVLTKFARAIAASKVLVAHNMNFDEKVIGAEFLRRNIPSALFDTIRVCTMIAGTEYCRIPGPYGFKWPTLSELYACLFDEDFLEVHDAAVDVRACAKCFFELKRLGSI